MAIIATDANRFSSVVVREYDPASAFCRDAVTYNGTAITVNVGQTLGAYYTGLTGTAGATVGTGNGVMGAITVTSVAGLETGVYTLRIYRAVTNAGDFELLSPSGRVVGIGQVATAYSQGGFAFTLADGSTDFVVGDTIPITVAGTKKFKAAIATATDGSQNIAAVVLADAIGLSQPQTPVVNTDTVMLAMTRGPVILNKGGLVFDASYTGAALTTAYNQLAALGMIPETQV